MPEASKGKDRILVLSVDRDNDIGEKAGMKGPIIGREAILKAAQGLGLADPEDSDMNALYQAVRVWEEVRKKYHAEVAAVTGHRNVGLDSDKMIAEQLGTVMGKFKADYVILVTDGTEDEHVMPIIQSKAPILSVRRVIVKQSEELESSYYKIKDFITESLENPKFSRLVFGLPAIALLLWALFGFEGWRVIIGVLGAYLFIKGFKLEKYITGTTDELQSALTRRRFAFFLYIIAILFIIFATYSGYISVEGFSVENIFEISAGFVSASIFLYYIGAAIVWIGRSIGKKKHSIRTIVSVTVFGLAVSVVIYSAAQLIVNPSLPIIDFILSIVMGFLLLFVAVLIEWKVKTNSHSD
jgi:putative membrane protein